MSTEFRGDPWDPRVHKLPGGASSGAAAAGKNLDENQIEAIVARYIAENAPSPDPTDDTHPDVSRMDLKASVRAASSGPVELSGRQVVDGVAIEEGERVLVKDQSDRRQNGIYIAAAEGEPWTRASDSDESAEVSSGLQCYVSEGEENAEETFVLTTKDPISVGFHHLNFKPASNVDGGVF